MKRIIVAVAIAMAFGTVAQAQVPVRGYTRSDGTYVAPHVRSSPNSTTSDNYGSYRPAPPPPPAPTYVSPASTAPACAGYACYGQPSTANGRPRTERVEGYTRSDGTYVAPYYRSAPD